MGKVYLACRWHLRYGAKDRCRHAATLNPTAALVDLDLGCPKDCPDIQVQPWKAHLYTDLDGQQDTEAPRTIEWEDEP